eukprot:556073_1
MILIDICQLIIMITKTILSLITTLHVLHVLSLTKSKLSIFSGMGDLSWQFIDNGKPQLVKIFDSFSDNQNAARIKNISSNIKIIGRIYQANQPTNMTPQQAALSWWWALNATILKNPDIDYWEGYNEPGVDTYEEISWISQMEVERLKILNANGLKGCIGNFAVGTPDITNATMIKAFYPAIESALQYNGILGLHEYSAPWMTDWFDNSTQTGWLTGRYRKLYEQYLIPDKIGTIPLVITELGIDGGCPSNTCESCGANGWQAFQQYWCQNGGSCNGPYEYSFELEWYDNLMMKDSYVLGANIYCLDIPGWETWQLTTDVVNDLTVYMNSMQSE